MRPCNRPGPAGLSCSGPADHDPATTMCGHGDARWWAADWRKDETEGTGLMPARPIRDSRRGLTADLRDLIGTRVGVTTNSPYGPAVGELRAVTYRDDEPDALHLIPDPGTDIDRLLIPWHAVQGIGWKAEP